MALKRKYTKVNLEWLDKEKTAIVAVPSPKGRFTIASEVQSLFQNRGKNYHGRENKS